MLTLQSLHTRKTNRSRVFCASLRQIPYVHAQRVRYLDPVAYPRLRPELPHRGNRRLRLAHRPSYGAIREIFLPSVNLHLIPKHKFLRWLMTRRENFVSDSSKN